MLGWLGKKGLRAKTEATWQIPLEMYYEATGQTLDANSLDALALLVARLALSGEAEVHEKAIYQEKQNGSNRTTQRERELAARAGNESERRRMRGIANTHAISLSQRKSTHAHLL